MFITLPLRVLWQFRFSFGDVFFTRNPCLWVPMGKIVGYNVRPIRYRGLARKFMQNIEIGIGGGVRAQMVTEGGLVLGHMGGALVVLGFGLFNQKISQGEGHV